MSKTSIIIGGIAIGIVAVIAVAVLLNQTDSDTIEITADDSELNQTQQEIIEKSLEEIEEETFENMDKSQDSEYDPSRPREWLTSGPFQIDRSEYYLGEKVFLRIGGLQLEDTGNITFLRPLNQTHYSVYLTIPFDSAKKQAFNYYIDPQLSKSREICSAEDIVGEWTVVFRGTDYPNLKFTYLNQTIPGHDDDYYKSVC
ncbi:MAG: hypothetical protein R3327_08120 [Nitrosopumilaceae archaeon]|nr:hypothetical protein [Nitrosopumilaceae archaeon]